MSSIFFSIYGVIDLKNKPMKVCVTYKIKLYDNKLNISLIIRELDHEKQKRFLEADMGFIFTLGNIRKMFFLFTYQFICFWLCPNYTKFGTL